MFSEESMTRKQKEYEEMSVEELRALLRQDILEDTLDEESIQMITTELRRKNQIEHFFNEPHVDEAWKRFDKRLTAEFPIEKDTGKKASSYPKRWIRSSIAVAAVFAFIFLGSVTANAFGYNPITYIAKWTDSVFHFATIVDASTDSIPYKELPDLLEQYGITDPVLPSWLPEGYVYTKCSDNMSSSIKTVKIQFTNVDTEEYIFLLISQLTINSIYNSEKDVSEAFVYTIDEIDHYLITNLDNEKAIWQADTYICHLSGNISRSEIMQIINSIY